MRSKLGAPIDEMFAGRPISEEICGYLNEKVLEYFSKLAICSILAESLRRPSLVTGGSAVDRFNDSKNTSIRK